MRVRHIASHSLRSLRPQRFALGGGAFYIGANARFIAERTLVVGSFFAIRGGIAFAGPGSFVVFRASTLSGGRAMRSGGAIYASQTAIVALIDSIVSGHTAQLTGGALYAEDHAKFLALSAAGGCEVSNNNVDLNSGQGALSCDSVTTTPCGRVRCDSEILI